jgi:hypothetical protein
MHLGAFRPPSVREDTREEKFMLRYKKKERLRERDKESMFISYFCLGRTAAL